MNQHVASARADIALTRKGRRYASRAEAKRRKQLARVRQAAVREIERLIAIVDRIDGDPDMEPSIGVSGYRGEHAVDAEHDDADDEQGAEDEYSLGSLPCEPAHYDDADGHWRRRIDRYANQERWAKGNLDEREDDGDDREPDTDDEYSHGWGERGPAGSGHGQTDDGGEPDLGWTDAVNQAGRNRMSPGYDGCEKYLASTPREDACRMVSRQDDDGEHDADHEDNGDREEEPLEDEGHEEVSGGGDWRGDGVLIAEEMLATGKPYVGENPKRRRLDAPNGFIGEFVDPADLPKSRYCMTGEGACMEPAIPDGAKVWVDPFEPVQNGDLAIIFLRAGLLSNARTNIWIKRIVSIPPVTFPYQHNSTEWMPQLVVEYDNPPTQLIFRASDVLAVHKCLGLVPDYVQPVPTKVKKRMVAPGECLPLGEIAGPDGRRYAVTAL